LRGKLGGGEGMQRKIAVHPQGISYSESGGRRLLIIEGKKGVNSKTPPSLVCKDHTADHMFQRRKRKGRTTTKETMGGEGSVRRGEKRHLDGNLGQGVKDQSRKGGGKTSTEHKI